MYLQFNDIQLKPGEIFLPVPNTGNKYHISNFGRVYSEPRHGLIATNSNGYIVCIMLHANDVVKKTSVSVGRFVLRHFRPNIEPENYIHHIDNDPKNNHINNLVWTNKRTL